MLCSPMRLSVSKMSFIFLRFNGFSLFFKSLFLFDIDRVIFSSFFFYTLICNKFDFLRISSNQPTVRLYAQRYKPIRLLFVRVSSSTGLFAQPRTSFVCSHCHFVLITNWMILIEQYTQYTYIIPTHIRTNNYSAQRIASE